MPILTEKMFIDMDRNARRKGLSDEETLEYYQSFLGQRVPEIPYEELTVEEQAEDLAYEVLLRMEQGNLIYEDIVDMFIQAHMALEMCKTCLPAYEACFQTCEHKAARDRYILKGVEEGERQFGGAYEKENAGNFWAITKTRPYMRLLAAKADLLLERKQRREAMQLYERMLVMHPDDAAGARFPLQSLYLEFGKYDEYLDLIDKFENDYTPHNFYNYALFLYMIEGENPDADEALQEAIEFNPHVLPYLKGKKKPKEVYISSYNPVDESGAIVYCRDALYLWHRQYGIQDWLKKF